MLWSQWMLIVIAIQFEAGASCSAGGRPCLFPFVYKNRLYKGCVVINSGSVNPWCPTSLGRNGVYQDFVHTKGSCDIQNCALDFGGAPISNTSIQVPQLQTTRRPGLFSPPKRLGANSPPFSSFSSNSGGGSPSNFGANASPSSSLLPNAGGGNPINFGASTFPSPIPSIRTTRAPFPAPPSIVQSELKPKCGVPNDSVGIRIVDGQPTQANKWPWMVAILTSGSLDFQCGGALISDQHVLTAAHCVVGFLSSSLIIRLGDYDLSLEGETKAATFDIDLIKYHAYYDSLKFNNDIAVIKVTGRVRFSEFIYPICLPGPGSGDYADIYSIVTGWGRRSSSGSPSQVLRQVRIRIWKQEICRRNYDDLQLTITPQMLCAGNNGRDSCKGDSGGPLNCLNMKDRLWELCGIVSWGFNNCGSVTYPGVYTRVTEFLPWILDQM